VIISNISDTFFFLLDIILKYFPELTEKQQQQFAELLPLYTEWNSKINVISRKDVEHFYERHVLHSLAIAKVISFHPNTKILDIGTGGGFPAIPLSIMFPEVKFHAVDSIGKKIKVVNEIAKAIGLKNVKATHARVETLTDHYDFVTARAVAPVAELLQWTKHLLHKKNKNSLANGWLLLKGGNLTEELTPFQKRATTYPIQNFFSESFFEEKRVIHLSTE
jgi:16S rRNA (guanine527-N7)-methyltransferase